MKKSIATAAVCGVSLFGFTAVAGAAGPPTPPVGNPPNASQAAKDNVGAGCNAVLTNNPTLSRPNLPYQFDSGLVGVVLCGLTP